jgi:hypothetical protein
MDKVNELATKILDSNGKELKIIQDLSSFTDNNQIAQFAQDVMTINYKINEKMSIDLINLYH